MPRWWWPAIVIMKKSRRWRRRPSTTGPDPLTANCLSSSALPLPARLNVIPRPGAPQSELRIGHVAVARNTPDYHALVAANMVLGGQFVSRINLNLREEKGFTYGARTSFDFRRMAGPFALQVSVQTAATAAGHSRVVRRDRGDPRSAAGVFR